MKARTLVTRYNNLPGLAKKKTLTIVLDGGAVFKFNTDEQEFSVFDHNGDNVLIVQVVGENHAKTSYTFDGEVISYVKMTTE